MVTKTLQELAGFTPEELANYADFTRRTFDRAIELALRTGVMIPFTESFLQTMIKVNDQVLNLYYYAKEASRSLNMSGSVPANYHSYLEEIRRQMGEDV